MIPNKQYNNENLIAPHGGYRNLKSFQTATLIYDLTVEFCKTYGSNRSYKSYRTNDQMIQAARSGRQNIAEGCQASGTSKKTELKLIGVARASLEELLLDYEDFLRQNALPLWGKDSPNSANFLLDRQLKALEKSFLEEGGFTERLYQKRTIYRTNKTK